MLTSLHQVTIYYKQILHNLRCEAQVPQQRELAW